MGVKSIENHIGMHREYSQDELKELLVSESGRAQLFDMIVKKYSKPLYYYLRRILFDHYDTDDVLQETFIKVWDNLDKFRGEASLYNWILRIATNKCFDFIRKKNKNTSMSIDEFDVPQIENDQQQEIEETENTVVFIRQAIETLPAKQRAVFNLKHFEGLKYSEISTLLGTSEGALKSSYHIAVNKIRTFVTQNTSQE